MREKIGPWVPALFCAALSFMAINELKSGATQSIPAPFLSFLPVSFFFVGNFLYQLQKENRELKERLDELASQMRCNNQAREQQ